MSDRRVTRGRPEAKHVVPGHPGALVSPRETTLVDDLLAEQQRLTAVERFSEWHDRGHLVARDRYSHLMPASPPASGEQYAFEVNLDACTGCKACVTACHSLNGLDVSESFRDAGLLIGDGYQQTVTTACHHCADPACANGCPVKAYEKDETTGIVRHLDDQCIGCQYCVLKCPYEVPKWNERLRIVRKCDMCAQRLAVGEAPACVQACPTSAISIVKRKTGIPSAGRVAGLLPDTFTSSYTQPTTTYVTTRVMPDDAHAADRQVLRVQHTHWPLVIMLVLTQLSAGLLIACLWHPSVLMPAVVALFAGLGSSVLHLGRPMGAWRFFLGLRKSWMSREILAFSVLAMLAGGMVVREAVCPPGQEVATVLPDTSRLAASFLALVAVFTSAMIYVDTRRSWWSASRTFVSFLGTVARLGASGAAALTGDALCMALALISGAVFLLAEAWVQRGAVISLPIVRERLSAQARLKQAFAILAMLCQAVALLAPALMFKLGPPAFACSLAACVLERVIFFKAVDAPKMPGGLTA